MSCPFRHVWNQAHAKEGKDETTYCHSTRDESQSHIDENGTEKEPEKVGFREENGAGSCCGLAADVPVVPYAPAARSSFQEHEDANVSKCPFARMYQNVREKESISEENNTSDSNGRSGAFYRENEKESGQENDGVSLGKCPLGFTSSASGRKAVSEWQCMICRSLLYDCVTTSCGHEFCRDCISKTKDCPRCGADVGELVSNIEKQGIIDTFLEHHAGDPEAWLIINTHPIDVLERDAVRVNSASSGLMLSGNKNNDEDESFEIAIRRAAFLLHIALQAMAANNLVSAVARFEQCRQLLERQMNHVVYQNNSNTDVENNLRFAAKVPSQPGIQKQLDETGACDSTDNCKARQIYLAERLGAVCGCIADCIRRKGDLTSSIQEYEKSITFLRIAADDLGPESEATQSLSVTMNKIGEAHHLLQNIPEAVQWYEKALKLRQSRLDGLKRSHSTEMMQQPNAETPSILLAPLLDVAVSEVKLADALMALDKTQRPRNIGNHIMSARRAVELCKSMQSHHSKLAPMEQHRLAALEAHLDTML